MLTIHPVGNTKVAPPSWGFIGTLGPHDDVIQAGSPTPVVDLDADFILSTGIVDHNGIAQVSKLDIRHKYTLENLTPSVCDLDATAGITSRKVDGTASLRVATGGMQQIISRSLSREGGAGIQTFSNFLAGSAARYMSDSVNAAIAGKTPSNTTQKIFNVENYFSPIAFVRNPDVFVGADLTCIPAGFLNAGSGFVGCAIAPDLVVTAYHAHYDQTLIFVTNDNQAITRSVTSGLRLSKLGDISDIYLQRLDSPLPSSITPAKVFPSNWDSKVKHWNCNIPVISRHQPNLLMLSQTINYYIYDLPDPQDFVVTTTRINVELPTGNWAPWWHYWVNPVDPTYNYPGISGDSASPQFFLFGNELVLYGVWSWPDGGYFLPMWISDLNTAAASLGSSYTVTEYDLSGYPSY